jgi:hypothetical protein
MNRIRQQIIDLDTRKIYLNELMAEKETAISRYYIHKSLTQRVPVREKMFAYYSYGMDVENLKNFYISNYKEKKNGKKL